MAGVLPASMNLREASSARMGAPAYFWSGGFSVFAVGRLRLAIE
jgi:hypothetical protein